MQKSYQIPTTDGKIIYGSLDSQQKSDKLIIFVHGLTGNMDEQHYFNAVPYFNSKGYDTFRFNFYSDSIKGRQISECSLKPHVDDLTKVITEFKNQYKQINLVGHSFGCYVIMNTNAHKLNKIIYWDPTLGMLSLKQKRVEYLKEIDLYVMKRGLNNLINKQMIDDWKRASDLEFTSKLISQNSYFIFAGGYNLYESWKKYLVGFPVEIIPDATHCFVEEGTVGKLYDATFNFLND